MPESEIIIYLKYKAFQAKENLKSWVKNLTKLKNLILLSSLLFLIYAYLAYTFHEFRYTWGVILSYVLVIYFAVYKDIVSGDHIRWHREKTEARNKCRQN